MRIIPLLAFIFVSTSLLSESYHRVEAIGVDSKSHGLLHDGQVVRRYGAGRFVYRGLQERAEPVPKDIKGPDPKGPDPKDDPKDVNKNPAPKDPKDPKNPDPPKAKEQDLPKAKDPNPKVKDPNPPPPKDPNTKDPSPKDQIPPKDPKNLPPKDPSTPKIPSAKSPAQKNDSKEADDTTDNTLPKDDPDQAAEQAQGTPLVNTGPLSTSAIGGLAAVGGVFVLVGGLFAFSQKRKNNEMTKSIVSSSAKAWEQQNSAYEVLEEEAKPLGSYKVIATYTPTLADELDIQPGDTVTILVEYDDGWVQGINETRGGIKGVFPRHCVDMNRASNKAYKNNKRSSSMGGYTEKYTEVDLS